MANRRAHYVVSTHWDREWYQPFQDYRYRLVHLLDGVLAGLASGELQGPFTTDGQAIILEDYLEVRPERRAELCTYAGDGRLNIGPWYVLPDEFIVSGEAMVRNLRLGRAIAREFGGTPSDAGFVCDIFGHNSQLPQLLAGFGMPMAYVWRGINENGRRLFRWIGADGTEVLAYRFERRGYSSYAGDVRSSFDQDHPFDAADVSERLDAFVSTLAAQTETDALLLFDGGDHQEWDRDAYAVLAERFDDLESGVTYLHSTLDRFAEEALAQRERISTTVHGELREPGRAGEATDSQWLIPGVLSSRIWIKQRNAACQAVLCHWAEPYASMASRALGDAYPQGYLDVAWRWLLKNHPHDSICGCSIDRVHEDMEFRFSQCEQIAERLTSEATRTLAANIDTPLAEDELRLVLFNPLPRPVTQVVSATLQTPCNWATFNEFFGFEPKPAFRMADADGAEVPYQRLAQHIKQPKTRIGTVRFPASYVTNDIDVAFEVSLPPLGYATLTVRQDDSGAPTRYPLQPAIGQGERTLENEYLRATIESDGSLTLTDKDNGAVYRHLLVFEDCADIGDGWYHGQAANDRVYTSAACAADVALIANGPLLGTLAVRTTMHLPEAFDWPAMRRAETMRELVIESRITLRKGARRLEIETDVDNTIRDHRLRVLLPSNAAATTFCTDTPFDVVERPIALRADNHLYRELEVETRPQQSFSAVWDGRRGLAVIAKGLPEVAVKDQSDRPIALTLYRSTQRTVGTAGEPGGQLLGPLAFAYWVEPLNAAPDWAALSEAGTQLNAGPRDVQLTRADLPLYQRESALPAIAGGLAIRGPVVLSSLRQVADGLELRLFNPNASSVQTEIEPGSLLGPLASVQRVNLDSVPLEEPQPIAEGRVAIELRAKEIVTLRLAPSV